MQIKTAFIDREKLDKNLPAIEGLSRSYILKKYIEVAESSVEQLLNNDGSADIQSVIDCCHRLRPSTALVGATKLCLMLESLENALSRNDTVTAARVRRNLPALAQATLNELSNLLYE